jgi:hypothetical protein
VDSQVIGGGQSEIFEPEHAGWDFTDCNTQVLSNLVIIQKDISAKLTNAAISRKARRAFVAGLLVDESPQYQGESPGRSPGGGAGKSTSP